MPTLHLRRTALIATLLAAFAAVRADAQPAAPPAYGSPFGPGYDPTRPPPTEPQTSGPGIASITATTGATAEIEEVRGTGAPAYYAVVLSIKIPAASTTPVLGTSSVIAKSEDGTTTPVYAICTPTAEAPAVTMYHGADARLARWHVAVGEKTYECGGRNARLAVEIGSGGMRMTTDGAWEGPMLLLFKTPSSPIRRVVVAGVEAELPQPKTEGNNQGSRSEPLQKNSPSEPLQKKE